MPSCGGGRPLINKDGGDRLVHISLYTLYNSCGLLVTWVNELMSYSVTFVNQILCRLVCSCSGSLRRYIIIERNRILYTELILTVPCSTTGRHLDLSTRRTCDERWRSAADTAACTVNYYIYDAIGGRRTDGWTDSQTIGASRY